MHKKLEIWGRRQEQWKPTSTPWIFLSFMRIFPYTFRNIAYNFFYCYLRISRKMNAKISKFKRKDKSNGIPLLHHGIFFFFHENFPKYIQKHSLQFLFYAVFVFQEKWMQNNLEIREGRQEQWNSTCTAWIFFFSFTRIFLGTFRNIAYNFYYAVFVFPE